MTGLTPHYGLSRIVAGDNLSDDGYKFTEDDRGLIDRLLYLGVEGHRHTGAVAAGVNPISAATLVASLTGGTIPAGTRVYYKYTHVDANGFETAASPQAFVDTPAPILEPAAAAISYSSTGGVLLPGVYYYALTAYTSVNTQETKGITPAYVTVPVGTSTNKITLSLPSLPAGATGFNIYSKKPGASRYNYLSSVVPSGATTFIDTGAIVENCNRTVPIRNNTNAANSVTVTHPGAVPVGSTWKLYRTYGTGQFDSSLLHWIVEETFETSGIIKPSYQDVGNATSSGAPPTVSQSVGSPSKINIANGTDITGNLPLGLIAFPVVYTFFWPGQLAVTTGTMVWTCEHPNMKIIGCRAVLGAGATPAATAVLVDVNRATASGGAFTTIYTTQANRPTVAVAGQRGVRTVPDVTALVQGDMVTVDIDQVGGGAGTDRDLTVQIYGVAYGYSATASFDPATPNIP